MPEYAFLTPAPIHAADGTVFSPSFVAQARTLGPVFALNALGYDARAYSLHGRSVDLAELRGAKAVVFGEGAAMVDGLAGPLLVRDNGEIPSPFDGPELQPRAPAARRRSRALEWLAARAGLEISRINLLWSGEETDLDSLIEGVDALQKLGRKIPLQLRCLTPHGDAFAGRVRENDPDALRLAVEAWTPQAMAHALAACDFVLFPRDPATPIHAGRYALSSDPAEGIRWALAHPREVLERLRRGQQSINQTHAPDVVARAWVRLFMKGRQ